MSLLPNDATDPAQANPILTTDGTANGGLDLIGGVFASSIDPVADPATSRSTQGSPQTLGLDYRAGDTLTSIDPEATVLELVPPNGGTVSLDGLTVTVPGEGTYRLDRGENTVTFQPEPQFTGPATPIRYRVFDELGGTATALLSPVVDPVARPDDTSGPQGIAQRASVLVNDNLNGVEVDPTTLQLVGGDGDPVDELVIPGQGTYVVAGDQIVFTPLPDFIGTATPARYQVDTVDGDTIQSTYTPSFDGVAPDPSPDTSQGRQGAPQSVDPLANDNPGDADVPLVPASLTLLDADGDPVSTVTVPDQRTYSISGGRVIFTPLPAFTGTASPVDYRIADANGTAATSTYTPSVVPSTAADSASGPQGVPVSTDPLANDGAPGVSPNPSTLTLVDANSTAVGSVTVPDQGTYTLVDGRIVFTPERDFTGTANPVDYRVSDTDGNVLQNRFTPTLIPVRPTARPDQTSGPQGIAQSTNPLANDAPGNPAVQLDPASLTLLDGDGDPVSSVRIAGQGVYTVDGSAIVFTPEPGFTAADRVDYRIRDVNGAPADSTYTPTVTPPTTQPSTPPETGSLPQTGASSLLWPSAGLGVLALVGGLIMVGSRRRTRH